MAIDGARKIPVHKVIDENDDVVNYCQDRETAEEEAEEIGGRVKTEYMDPDDAEKLFD